MVILLVACMLIAPFIRNLKALRLPAGNMGFSAPGVFVTVLFGLF